jgi:hypothetical protein
LELKAYNPQQFSKEIKIAGKKVSVKNGLT